MATNAIMRLKIMPIGDSMTRGSYLVTYEDGPFAGQAIGLPHPAGGGWRKRLQDHLRAAGVAFEFVGELDYGAYGREGVVDPDFQPAHHGLAGFGNQGILDGGVVPTPADVLAARGVAEIRVPDIVTALARHKPNVVLLMSGANGFDAPARDRLMRTVLDHYDGILMVATIPPQRPPREGWERVDDYNASLSAAVAELNEEYGLTGQSTPNSLRQGECGHVSRVTIVAVYRALTADDLMPDGVHPSRAGMEKIAAAWWGALKTRLRAGCSGEASPGRPPVTSSPNRGVES